MVLSSSKDGIQSQSENASILRSLHTTYSHSSNGITVSNNHPSKDCLEAAPTNENASAQTPSTVLVAEEGASLQSSSFVAHSLFKNQANTGNTCGSQSPEQQELPLKAKKIISPFAPEATVPLPDLLPCWSLGTTVWKRNERERYRVRCVNEGYEKLRNHLPIHPSERRLSKVDTLRLAIYYIRHLDHLLCDSNHNLKCECFTVFGTEDLQI